MKFCQKSYFFLNLIINFLKLIFSFAANQVLFEDKPQFRTSKAGHIQSTRHENFSKCIPNQLHNKAEKTIFGDLFPQDKAKISDNSNLALFCKLFEFKLK